MNFGEAILHNIRNSFRFSGRDPRSSFWWYVLFVFLGSIVANTLDGALLVLRAASLVSDVDAPEQAVEALFANPATLLSFVPFTIVWTLINIPPLFACGLRRRHDCDKAGTFYVIACIVGAVAGLAGLYYMIAFFDVIADLIATSALEGQVARDGAGLPFSEDQLNSIVQVTGITSILSLVQFIAGVIILIMMLMKGTAGPNRYGNDPLAE